MKKDLKEKFEVALWIAESLFKRNKVSGSSANLSFKHENNIFITGTNTCFGRLSENDFSVISLEGNFIKGIQPSKEFPLHLMMYKNKSQVNAVIHVHSFYATLWSCLEPEDEYDILPSYTPYLDMKLGKITLIDYGMPGSEELFNNFKSRINEANGYILKNHGSVVGEIDLLSAFYALEELEESAKIAWYLKNKGVKTLR